MFSCILSDPFSCILSSPLSCILSYMFPIMNVPFPLFPAHFSLPMFPVKSSHWRLFHKKLLHTEVLRYFPAHLSLPTFSYTFSLFRLFPCPLFPSHVPCQKQSVASDSQESPPLLSLCVFPFPPPPLPLFPTHFPYFDYFPAHLSSLMISCCLYKILQWQIIVNCLSEQNSQTISYAQFVSHPPVYSFFMQNCVLLSGLVNF
jgi:hypothetical protein